MDGWMSHRNNRTKFVVIFNKQSLIQSDYLNLKFYTQQIDGDMHYQYRFTTLTLSICISCTDHDQGVDRSNAFKDVIVQTRL